MTGIEYIEKIYFINLNHRVDRLCHIENVLKNLKFKKNKIKKIEAEYVQENGSLGCAISHVKTLNEFIKSNKNNCLILEDDFNYFDIDLFNKSIDFFFKLNIEWDIIQLASNTIRYSNTDHDYLIKIEESQTTSAYLLNRKFASKLKRCFYESVVNLKNEFKIEYCIDQNWKKIQSSSLWFCFDPKLGYQIDGYSDIEKQIVSYKC